MPRLLSLRGLAVAGALGLIACSSDKRAPVDTVRSADAGGDASLRDASVPSLPDAQASAEASAEAGVLTDGYPPKLSQTGLFVDVKNEITAPGVRAYQPKYVLWADGASKGRWVFFPAGSTIDTTNMDFWVYPVGTKVWKEFGLDGKRIETRYLHKVSDTEWTMIAYQWNEAQTEATAVPDGVQNANGTPHDIPQKGDCAECHENMPDKLLGVTAIQLSHELPGMKLTDLIAEKRLSKPPAAPFQIPGDPVTEKALGYLHANCGHCHNPNSAVSVAVSLDLWESTTALDTPEHTTGFRTTVLRHNSVLPNLHIIEPGHPELSELFLRISTRGVGAVTQMPPLATEIVDPTGIATIRAWIESLPAVDAGSPPLRDAAPD